MILLTWHTLTPTLEQSDRVLPCPSSKPARFLGLKDQQGWGRRAATRATAEPSRLSTLGSTDPSRYRGRSSRYCRRCNRIRTPWWVTAPKTHVILLTLHRRNPHISLGPALKPKLGSFLYLQTIKDLIHSCLRYLYQCIPPNPPSPCGPPSCEGHSYNQKHCAV